MASLPTNSSPLQPPPTLDRLYRQLFEAGVTYFFPEAQLRRLGKSSAAPSTQISCVATGAAIRFEWLGSRYALEGGTALSDHECRMLTSIGQVLWARHELLSEQSLAGRTFGLFRGVPEDRYVSAFLDPSPHASAEAATRVPDRLANAIEVLRTSSMTTYENRRIATGVLLFGPHPDPCHALPDQPEGALRYSDSLTTIRSFHRLCDGLQTLALVDQNGALAELVDVQQWAEPYADFALPVPAPSRYQAHSRATLCGGHVCLILTTQGEIKVFGDGVQMFRFIDGKWRLSDSVHKYERWRESIGTSDLAERIFSVGLNLAEDRRGALFVVLDDPRDLPTLVATTDLLDHTASEPAIRKGAKHQLHYLLRGRKLADIPPTVLENIARIDGAVVVDKDSNVLAFGAILRHDPGQELSGDGVEGGRTTAAIAASNFGSVLKISEDGLLSFYKAGQCSWEL